jgi:hypothetical protein
MLLYIVLSKRVRHVCVKFTAVLQFVGVVYTVFLGSIHWAPNFAESRHVEKKWKTKCVDALSPCKNSSQHVAVRQSISWHPATAAGCVLDVCNLWPPQEWDKPSPCVCNSYNCLSQPHSWYSSFRCFFIFFFFLRFLSQFINWMIRYGQMNPRQ